MDSHHPLRTKDQEAKSPIYAELNAKAEVRAKTCPSATMPSLNHLHMNDYQNVYEPSDDTYLLIDAIGMDIDTMDKLEESKGANNGGGLVRTNIKRSLEIGCGTGVPSIYLAMRLRNINESDLAKPKTISDSHNNGGCNVRHYVTDINPEALRIAKVTAEVNGIPENEFIALQCDLASDLLEKHENDIDILVFNPPYVPTPDDEVGSNGIEASWAGGTNGRVVLDRAIPQIARLLAFPHGVGYLITVDDNYPEDIADIFMTKCGIKVVPWLRRRARNEFLTVLRLTPTREFRREDNHDNSS